MNLKQLLEYFLTITILLSTMINAQAQPNRAMPESAGSYSTWGTPQNMGPIINGADTEFLPVEAPNVLSLYYAPVRPEGLGGRDIFVSQRATPTSAWGPPQNVTILNSVSNESVGSISPDGREMFMESDRPGGTGLSDIYRSTRTDPNNDFGWTAPVNIGTVLNTVSNDYFATYFVDPAIGAASLIFLSDRVGGLGLNDIYQSTRSPSGEFNSPMPVTELNSTANEQRTSISRDGLEMFFGSNRLGPATIFAIFTSTRGSTSSPWSPPVSVASLCTVGSNAQPFLSPDGRVLYWVSNRPGGSGLGDLYSATRISVNRTATVDFNGDGLADISFFRPSNGTWYILDGQANTWREQAFGTAGDKIAPGDYDGDSRTDFAVFRPSTGVWWIQRSSDNSVSTTAWGIATDKPVPADYDGDGRTDIAVYRDGTWYIVRSSNGGFDYRVFGASGDIPIAGVQ